MSALADTVEERIAQRSAELVLEGLKSQGLTAPSYPEKMSTSAVAKAKGCKPVTVQRNWREWGLQRLGRGLNREMQFSGLSVQRHIERGGV